MQRGDHGMASASLPIAKRDVSSEWFRALVTSALDGVVTMDDKGNLYVCSEPSLLYVFSKRETGE